MSALHRAKAAVEQMEKALRPLSSCVYNDNGDMTVTNWHHIQPDDCIRAYWSMRAAQSAIDDLNTAIAEAEGPKGQKFTIGQHVRKKSGSEWQGWVCGYYSREITPEGYAVKSEFHKGSVQIYPASALELVPAKEENDDSAQRYPDLTFDP